MKYGYYNGSYWYDEIQEQRMFINIWHYVAISASMFMRIKQRIENCKMILLYFQSFFCTFIYNILLRIIQTSYIFDDFFLTENKQAYASVNLTFRKLLYLYYRENDLNNRYSTRNVDKYFSLSENSRIILLKGN